MKVRDIIRSLEALDQDLEIDTNNFNDEVFKLLCKES